MEMFSVWRTDTRPEVMESDPKPKPVIFSNARIAAMISKPSDGDNSIAERGGEIATKQLEAPSSTKKIWPRQADCSSFRVYYDKYAEIVVGSEGFIAYPDATSTIMGGIGPCGVNDKYAKEAAKYAVEEHNKQTRENVTLKNIVKANSQFANGLVFYMTLETLVGDQTSFKEAVVHQYVDGSQELHIFRDAIYYYKIKELESNLGGNADSSTKRSAGRYQRVLYGTQLLDTLLTYLWRIHGVNYYGMIETDYPEGFRHVRLDDKDHGETSESGDEWLHKLHSFWYKRLTDPWVHIRRRGPRRKFKRMRSNLLTHPWKPMIMKQKLDAADIEAFYRCKCVKKIYDENKGWMFGCVADGCTELFHCYLRRKLSK
ncbi:hypothetical protein FEM48_Zijuj03G0179600 [Ziziphus jujuba var. spinosa]|uniref:Cystatin domain-containing protein n=1 Tax=Ziziphus jujuba var. spinosa TaxID=714518 RepID=A0A978VRS8_ZIZJJ|nr:hypothetical protein FEM48_Zijuj03G0179600 [Ziziphus jujuba var. spinosa]